MKILKNTLIVSSYVLLVALFFGGGYAIGRIGVSDSVPTPMPTVAAVEEVNANDVKTTVYEVKVENGLLQINKCVGDNKTAILSEEISENVFPSEDIDELKKGVEFDNLDEAQQMFENFVSYSSIKFMNNLLKHQKGDIERNKKKNKENKSKYSNILKKRTLLNGAKKNIIALLALKKCEC